MNHSEAVIYREETEVIRLVATSREELYARVAEEYVQDELEEHGYQHFSPRKLGRIQEALEEGEYDRAVELYFQGVSDQNIEWRGAEEGAGFGVLSPQVGGEDRETRLDEDEEDEEGEP